LLKVNAAKRGQKILDVDALRNAFSTAQFGNAVFATQAVQHDPDLFFRSIMLACCALDVFDDLLAEAFACSSCLSHHLLLSGY
jgi:hypothetical protein